MKQMALVLMLVGFTFSACGGTESTEPSPASPTEQTQEIPSASANDEEAVSTKPTRPIPHAAPPVPDAMILGEGGPEPADLGPATEEFARLEARLLAAESLALSGTAIAQGVVTAELDFSLHATKAGWVDFRIQGLFMSETVDRRFTSNSEVQCVAEVAESRRVTAPYLWEALILGLTRMGIMHNMALLVNGSGPDFADEGLHNVVGFQSFANLDELGAIAWQVVFRGQPTAMAHLWIRDGLPTRREQRVSFAEGDMRVDEAYHVFELNPDARPDTLPCQETPEK